MGKARKKVGFRAHTVPLRQLSASDKHHSRIVGLSEHRKVGN
jgi:hypothetical protein